MVQIRVGSEPIQVRVSPEPITVQLGEETRRAEIQANRSEDEADRAEAAAAIVETFSNLLRLVEGGPVTFKYNAQGLAGADVIIRDLLGNVAAGIETGTGALFAQVVKVLGELRVPELKIGSWTFRLSETNYDVVVCDQNRNAAVGLLDGAWLTAADPGGESATDAPLNMVAPPHLFFVKSRRLPLYPDCLLRERTNETGLLLTLSSIKSVAAPAYFASSFAQIDVDANDIGTSGVLTMRRAGDSDAFYTESVTLHAAASTGTGTKRALFVGDSKTNRSLPLFTGTKLGSGTGGIGYTFSTVGTMQNGGSGSWNGEGREGMEAADLTFAKTDFFTGSNAAVIGAGANGTVAAGNEAAYLALSDANKLLYNPFLRPATGGDNPDYVNNGYILDFANYFSRFSLTVPDIGVFGLLTNDDLQSAGDGTATGIPAIAIIRARWRADYATKPLLFWFGGTPRGSTGDDIWNAGGSDDHGAVAQALISFTQGERTGGDTNLWFCGAYAHMSPVAGWTTATDSTDAETGTTEVHITDSVHPANAAYQCADALAAAIHCILTGA